MHSIQHLKPLIFSRGKSARQSSVRRDLFLVEQMEDRRLLSVAINAPAARDYGSLARSFVDLPLAAQQVASSILIQQAKLSAADGAVGGLFGAAVSIDGNTAVAVGGDAAYVFTDSDSVWSQVAKLTSSDVAGGFGCAVAISGDTVLVGADAATVGANANQGAAYVFTEPASGWENMTETAKLTAADGAAGDEFGYAVAISGNTVVIGAYGASVGGRSGQGGAYAFSEAGGAWASMTLTAELTASDGAANDHFGDSVAISGNSVVVGAEWATIGGNYAQGAVYEFTEPTSGWANTNETAKLTASDGALASVFGSAVAISGDTVLVSGRDASKGAYLFSEPASGWANMTETAELSPSDSAPGFGSSVALSGNTALVGAWSTTIRPFSSNTGVGGANGEGTVYVFMQPTSGWANTSETEKLAATDGAANDQFGTAVSISAGTVMVGAPGANVGNNTAQGAAYLFAQLQPPTVNEIAPASGPASGGTAVVITGTNLARATAVDFGNLAASSFTIGSNGQITAVSPAEQGGIVDVTVTTSAGISPDSATDQFTYMAAVEQPVCRLYSPVTLEHLYTTDTNEYNTLILQRHITHVDSAAKWRF